MTNTDPAAAHSDFRDAAQRWDGIMTTYYPQRSAEVDAVWRVIDHCLDAAPTRLLDIGAGLGTITDAAAQRWPSARVTAADMDPVMCYVAERIVTPRADVVCLDTSEPGWHTRWGAGTFDAVFSVASLHYVSEDALRVIADGVAALLRPGGVFVNCDVMDDVTLTPSADPGGEADDADVQPWKDWWVDLESTTIPDDVWAERKALFEGRDPNHDLPLRTFASTFVAAGLPTWHATTVAGGSGLFVARASRP